LLAISNQVLLAPIDRPSLPGYGYRSNQTSPPPSGVLRDGSQPCFGEDCLSVLLVNISTCCDLKLLPLKKKCFYEFFITYSHGKLEKLNENKGKELYD